MFFSFQASFVTRLQRLSQDAKQSQGDYPDNIEVSYNDFKHVERLLPLETVPEPKENSHYPSPSGWFPPNGIYIYYM